MPLTRVRIRTLMIAVAIVAVILAGLLYDPVRVVALGLILLVVSPVLALLVYYARKLGLNTLFR